MKLPKLKAGHLRKAAMAATVVVKADVCACPLRRR